MAEKSKFDILTIKDALYEWGKLNSQDIESAIKFIKEFDKLENDELSEEKVEKPKKLFCTLIPIAIGKDEPLENAGSYIIQYPETMDHNYVLEIIKSKLTSIRKEKFNIKGKGKKHIGELDTFGSCMLYMPKSILDERTGNRIAIKNTEPAITFAPDIHISEL